MDKITPFIWFNGNAEEAMNFYCSIFKNAKPGEIRRYPNGSVLTVSFELEGQRFVGINGGPEYRPTPGISFFVDCVDQREVDELWEKLTSGGGKPSRCGWLEDKFGVSWQIIPKALGEALSNPDRDKAGRAMAAMLKMSKIEIDKLRDA